MNSPLIKQISLEPKGPVHFELVGSSECHDLTTAESRVKVWRR